MASGRATAGAIATVAGLALGPFAGAACDRAAGTGEVGDAGADAIWTCPGSKVDAELGACRAPLPVPAADCAGTWAEQKLRGCEPGVVVFVSAEDPSIRQWIWFDRPWFSGGLSCFYDSASGALAGFWSVKDYLTYCCGTSYDVTYGEVDHDLHEAAVRAANPWVGKLYDVDGTAPVDGGEVRYCASPQGSR